MSLVGAINVCYGLGHTRRYLYLLATSYIAESGALNVPASKKLYLEEGKMFKEVMHIMSRDRNFRAT